MTVTDPMKILNRKTKQNEAQYYLDREAAKISALSSNNLDKYEYLTSEDLGLKPITVDQAKFEYSPLGKVFNTGLSEEDKKERLLKRLKNIEDKNKVQNKVENKDIKEVTDFVDQPLSFEAKELLEEIKTIQKNVNYRKLKIKGGNMKDYDFSDYRTFKELFRDLYYRTITIDEAESKQDEFNTVLHLLKKYSPKHDKYVTLKNNLVDNASKFYKGREKIIEGFKNGVFPFYYDRDHEEQMKYEEEKEEDELMDMVEIEDGNRKSDHLVSKYFFVPKLKDLLKYFIQNKNDPKKNNQLVNIIKSRLKDLNNKINEMSEKERKNEKLLKEFLHTLNNNKNNQERA